MPGESDNPWGRQPRIPGMSVFMLLVVVALALAIVSLVRPRWPVLPVAVILISLALILSRRGF
jgi:fatty acid desaturase